MGRARSQPLGLTVALLSIGCHGAIGDQDDTSSLVGVRTLDPAATGPTAGRASSNPAAACALPAARIWKLTPAQYTRSVRDLVVTTADPGSDLLSTIPTNRAGFSNDADALQMTEPHVSKLLDTALALSAEVTAHPERLAPCLEQAPDDACVQGALGHLVGRAFRRAPSAEETQAYWQFYSSERSASDAKTALAQVVSAVLMSPHFLFRTELGPENADAPTLDLTADEKASALSYLLANGPPDDPLREAAAAGNLASPQAIEAQVRRLLSSADQGDGLLTFLQENFGTERVRFATKRPETYPTWSTDLAGELASEARTFFRSVLWSGNGGFENLFTSRTSTLSPSLATYYGSTKSGEVELPLERTGILTRGALMASLARENDTAPVLRGKYIRESLLCHTPPPPPATVSTVPPPPDGAHTQRERLSHHAVDSSCAGCHALMDPLGLAFETYDGEGQYRTLDVGKPIDTSGVLVQNRPDGAKFANAVELSQILATSPDAQSCFASRAATYASGHAASDSSCTDSLAQKFEAAHGNLVELMVLLTTSDTFFLRSKGQ